MTNAQLKALSRSTELFLDGTFKYAPKKSTQLYTVYGLIKKTKCVPVVHAVMFTKTKKAYKKLFK
jgi:hypothetical protein